MMQEEAIMEPVDLKEMEALLSMPVASPQELQKAFSLFNTQTEKLLNTYQALELRFLSLNSQLAFTQSQLVEKVTELSRTRFHLQALLDHMAEGLIFISPQGEILTLTPQALCLLNLQELKLPLPFHSLFKDDFFGFSLEKHLHLKSQPPASLLTLDAKDSRSSPTYLYIKGSYICLENKALSEITKERQSVEGLMILIRDVSEIHRKQVLNQRSERLRQLGELTARLAHEIRNPLGAIEGFASLLKRDLQNSDLLSMVEAIQEASHRVNALVTQVLHYGRPLVAHILRQDLIETIHHAIEAAQVSGWMKSSQRLLWEKPQEALNVEHDRELTQSCLGHLLKNAAQALGDQGEISISLENHKHQTIIRVKDTGHGIKSEDLEKIFTPLFSTKTEGNGLGLCEVSKMMAAQGGKVEVTSALGRGSIFILIFNSSDSIHPQQAD